MRQSKRSFVESIDFRTSAGNLGGAGGLGADPARAGLARAVGPSVVVTDLGIWHFDDDGEMRLDSLHPGATLDDVTAATGWEPKVAATVADDTCPNGR